MSVPLPDFDCPHCDRRVSAPTPDAMGVVKCPHCRGLFSLPEPDERREPVSAETTDDTFISAGRVRLLSARKRSLLRTRSFAVIGAGVCLAGSVLLITKAVRGILAAGTFQPRQLAFVLIASACAVVASLLITQAVRLTRAFRTSDLAPPTAPPDFTPLSDGSQRWKNLEDVR